MAKEGKEDRFGSLVKFCRPTSSQELKLQTCSFARESESFSDYFDSLATASPDTTMTLDKVGIVIVSPPESDSQKSLSTDKSNSDTQENENEDFLTPPEHYNPSSSSQEDPQRPKQVTPAASKGSASVVAETTVEDDERVENEVSGNFRKGENLGFSETERIDRHDEVFVNEVREIGKFEREMKRFRGSDGEFDKALSKKIRVLEETMDINGNSIDHEIIDLDTEEIDEKIQSDKGKIIIDIDTLEEEVAEDGDVRRSEKEKGVHMDGGDKCLKVNGILNLAEFEEGVRDNNKEVQRVGKPVSDSGAREKHGKLRCAGPDDGAKRVKERVPRGRHELTSSTKEKDMRVEESIRNMVEVQQSKNSGSGGYINHKEKEKDIASCGGDKCLKVKWSLALAESENGIRCNSNNKANRNGKVVLGSSSIEKIEKFRYESPGKGVDHLAMKRDARGRRDLPPSIGGVEKDMGQEESSRYIKVKKGSWKDLVDALEVVFGNADDGCEDVDFLETAKRRGLTFPQPRWI